MEINCRKFRTDSCSSSFQIRFFSNINRLNEDYEAEVAALLKDCVLYPCCERSNLIFTGLNVGVVWVLQF